MSSVVVRKTNQRGNFLFHVLYPVHRKSFRNSQPLSDQFRMLPSPRAMCKDKV